nr:MAG: hypothetical protein [Bacteriophage sp.]
MAQFIYLNSKKISVKSISQLHKISEEDKVKLKLNVNFIDRKQKDKTLMVLTGKDASKMANIAMCEIYGKITEGDNVYLEDIKTNLTAIYPKKFFICELQEK